jgi:hypothetical protein
MFRRLFPVFEPYADAGFSNRNKVDLLFHTSNSLRVNILRTFAPPKLNCFTADYKEVGPNERNTEGFI